MAGQRQTGGAGRGGNGVGGGGGGKKTTGNKTTRTATGQKKVVSISTKKPLTPAQMKAREVKARLDRVKKSEAAQDLKNRNLDNFNKKFDRKPRAAVTRKNNSPFGPVAAGIVKTKPKPKGKK